MLSPKSPMINKNHPLHDIKLFMIFNTYNFIVEKHNISSYPKHREILNHKKYDIFLVIFSYIPHKQLFTLINHIKSCPVTFNTFNFSRTKVCVKNLTYLFMVLCTEFHP